MDNRADLSDFEICNRYNIDNTGLVCKFISSSSQLVHYGFLFLMFSGADYICIKYSHHRWLKLMMKDFYSSIVSLEKYRFS